MSNKLEEMALMAHLYPEAYAQLAPQQAGHVANINLVGEGKRRRRRRKDKGGDTGLKKRKLSPEQVNLLELSFDEEHKLESERKDKLASELGLDPRQVAVWFQNRRARWKAKKLEDEYSKLKAAHDSAIVEKCRLETEVLKLKDQLCDTQKEIQRLSERADVNSSDNSPSSPSILSMEAIQPPFLGDFGMESYDNVIYLPECDYVINGMDWMYM